MSAAIFILPVRGRAIWMANAGGVVDTGGEIVSIANAHILLTGTTGARGTIRTTRVTSSGGMDTFTFDGGQLTAKANEKPVPFRV